MADGPERSFRGNPLPMRIAAKEQRRTLQGMRRCHFIEFSNLVSQQRLRATEISALAGVNADFFALIDEGRDLDYQSGFGLGGVGYAGCSCGLEGRVCLNA